MHLEARGLDAFRGEKLLTAVADPETSHRHQPVYPRGHARRERLIDAKIGLRDAAHARRDWQESGPRRQIQIRELQPQLARSGRDLDRARDPEASARKTRGHVEPARRRDRPGDVGETRPQRLDLEAPVGSGAGVQHAGRAVELESSKRGASVLIREVGSPRRHLRHQRQQLAGIWPDEREVLDLSREICTDAGSSVQRHLDSAGGASAVQGDGSVRRQVQPSQRQIQSLDGDRGLQLDRYQPKMLHLDRDGRAPRHGAADRATVAAPRGQVVRFDLDVFGRPRPRLTQRPVFEGDSAPLQREPLDGDVESAAARPGAPDQVREVEFVCESNDVDGRVVQHDLPQPHMSAQERQQVHPQIKAFEVREWLAAIAFVDTEAANRELPSREVDVDGVDANRAVSEGMDLRDQDVANQSG
jgi:hypothetical protein